MKENEVPEPEEELEGQGGRESVAEEELVASSPVAAAALASGAAFSRRFSGKIVFQKLMLGFE